jgi:hypothetical protein
MEAAMPIKYVAAVLFFLVGSTGMTVAWQEYTVTPPKREFLFTQVPYCDTLEHAEDLSRRMAFGPKRAYEHVMLMNHQNGFVCGFGWLMLKEPEKVRSLSISVWDIWIYRVSTRRGTKYVPVRDASRYRDT